MKTILLAILMPFVALALVACGDMVPSSQKRERVATEQLANQAAVTVGMPAITRFTEKRQLKMVYELRDNPELVTYTYTRDLQGKLHKVCPTTSIGYGIPYATQYSNPHTPITRGAEGITTIEQPEPNGLFMPGQADATWVLCLNPKTSKIEPVYEESKVTVYTYPIEDYFK